MWVEESINNLYEAGLTNDKHPLLYLENQNAQISVKTVNGMSKRTNVKNIVMQGTVWGSGFCTTNIDKLGKISYNNPELLYKYKGEVDVPILGMVDDVLTVSKCSSKTVELNATVNSFMENNKLKLAQNKCKKIHVGKKSDNCPSIKVHEENMENSNKEKYLGDQISHTGLLQETIDSRIEKAWSYYSEIRALLNDMPFGKRKIEVGLILREAMFLNGVLFNSEAWHGLTSTQITKLENVDHQLLRFIISGHAKVPVEFLYLETGTIPLRLVISSRRLNYLKNIVDRNDKELVKRIYLTQMTNTTSGDWIELVRKDFINIFDKEYNEEQVARKTKSEFKQEVKIKINNSAFKYLINKQKTHTKIKEIEYSELKIQEYITTHNMTNNEKSLLFSLRSNTIKNIKNNFHTWYKDNIECPLCDKPDTQQHCMECEKILAECEDAKQHIKYKHIFGDSSEQIEVTKYFGTLLDIREELLSKDQAY